MNFCLDFGHWGGISPQAYRPSDTGTMGKKRLNAIADRAASSLAINLLQLGCCIQQDPIGGDYGHEGHADWMSRLAKLAPHKRLGDTVIPGTHDSASFTISRSRPFSAVGITQSANASGQLERGARYLDLRIGGVGTRDDGDVRVCHGILTGSNFAPVLREVFAFAEAHPGEFIVIDVVLEYGWNMTGGQREFLLRTVRDVLRGRMITREDRVGWFDPGSVTLGQIAERRKNFLVMVDPRIYNEKYSERYIEGEYNFFRNGDTMRNKWHNTRDAQELLRSNIEEMEIHQNRRNIFLNNSFVLTPGVSGVVDILNILIGRRSLRPVSFAMALYEEGKLANFLRETACLGWNFVTFDFIDLSPCLISFLIGLNSPVKLQILKAVVKTPGSSSSDVTDKIQGFLKRECTLYLTNVQKDLRLDFSEGKLTVALRFDGGQCNIHEIAFDNSTELLISHFNQSRGTTVKLDASNKPEGAICCGCIYDRDDCLILKEKDETVLEFFVRSDRSELVFDIVS